jgi:Plasmid pRiA4b ORF-3-like protein
MQDQVDAILRITIEAIRPKIVRVLQVPHTLPLDRLHKALKIAVGWNDDEGHWFCANHTLFGNRRKQAGVEDERKRTLADLVKSPGDEFSYVYDPICQWVHFVRLESFARPSLYPVLLDGSGGCPDMIDLDFSALDSRSFDPGTINYELLELAHRWLTQAQRKQFKTARPVNTCRALLLIDDEPIRRRYLNELKRARAEVVALENVLSEHRDEDVPAFQRAMALQFGPRMSVVRQMIDEMHLAKWRIELVETLVGHGIRPVAAAFDRMLRIEKGELPMPDFGPGAEDDDEPGDGWVRAQLRALAEDSGLADDLDETELNRAIDEAVSGHLSEDARVECRGLYRKIVLALHPDRAGAMSESEKSLWLRAQESYRIGDVLGLRSAWAEASGGTAAAELLTCSAIKDAIAEAQVQVESLRLIQEQLKSEPSWQFRRLTKRQLASRWRRVARELDESEASLRETLAELQVQLAKWEGKHRRWLEKQKGRPQQQELL